MLRICTGNHLNFRYVLTDSRFSSKETMCLIKSEISKDFIMAIKSGRAAALSLEDKKTVILFRPEHRNRNRTPFSMSA